MYFPKDVEEKTVKPKHNQTDVGDALRFLGSQGSYDLYVGVMPSIDGFSHSMSYVLIRWGNSSARKNVIYVKPDPSSKKGVERFVFKSNSVYRDMNQSRKDAATKGLARLNERIASLPVYLGDALERLSI